MSSFSERVWASVAPIREAMIAMPFNAELRDGSLSCARVQDCLLQDSLYSMDYARTLASISARAPDGSLILEYSKAAGTCIVVERALHEGFLTQFGLTKSEIETAEASPTTLAYTQYLWATAYCAAFEVAVAAVLPCFWVYREVGLAIAAESVSDNPYQAWIDTYAGEEFGAAVTRQIAITDWLAAEAATHTVTAMTAAYRMKTWPV